MENSVIEFKGLESNVVHFEDRSDSMVARLRLTFQNGYGISIIKGIGTYGSEQGLYEIAPLDKDGDLDGSMLNIDGDEVEGHLSKDEVIDRAKKIISMI